MVFYGFAPSAINLDVLIHTFSGVSAGAIATLTLHPVDLGARGVACECYLCDGMFVHLFVVFVPPSM